MNEPQAKLIDLLNQRQVQLKNKFLSSPADTVMVHPNISQAEMQVMAQVAKDDPPETFLYASNQAEMSKAQEQLVAWATQKVKVLRKELNDAAENVHIATKRKWKKAPFEHIMERAAKTLTFYEKVELALKAGYTIVPDMMVELFAIRTVRKGAKKNETKGRFSRPVDQKTSCSPAGEGRYVTPQGEQLWRNELVKHDPGKPPEYQMVHWTAGHDEEIDFPFKMARPQILTATAKAMQENVFDEMGCLPRFRTQPDPVIVGRIVHREGYHEKRFNFLVVWFLDTKEL